MGERQAPSIEVVDVDDLPREMETILRHYLARVRSDPDGFRGLMIVVEQPEGAFEMKYTGSANAAERIGRLEILKDAMLDSSNESPVEDRSDEEPGFQPSVARRRRGS